jgi:uncharacterized membrane protein
MFTKTDIEKYFNAEKSESGLFIAIGIIAVVLALVFFFGLKTNFYKGAAMPLLLVGLLLGIVGFSVYQRSDADRLRNVYAYDMNPSQIKEQEIPRMEKVMKNFVLYRYIEIALAIIGIGLFFYFNNIEDKLLWKGFGLTLFIMAIVALGADFFAEKRGAVYLNGLKEFTKTK